MLKPEQVPYDAVRAAHAAWAGGGGNNVLSAMENAIAAAINAWPGAEWLYVSEPVLALPMPKEPTDDK